MTILMVGVERTEYFKNLSVSGHQFILSDTFPVYVPAYRQRKEILFDSDSWSKG